MKMHYVISLTVIWMEARGLRLVDGRSGEGN